ncbi:MAG: hypothetical protein ACI4VL_05395 [Bacilli bacterium]
MNSVGVIALKCPLLLLIPVIAVNELPAVNVYFTVVLVDTFLVACPIVIVLPLVVTTASVPAAKVTVPLFSFVALLYKLITLLAAFN